ncbi:MAG: hypothetical protein VZS44_05070 [Bacilli bacterium]|nr:hypothetical protein [Bacilli bacterium]
MGIIINGRDETKAKKLEYYYNKEIDKIISKIPNTLNEIEKLRFLYEYFVKNIEYDHDLRINRGENGKNYAFDSKTYNYKDIEVPMVQKYSALLCKKSICDGISNAFKDICEKIGIKCEVLEGTTTIQHGWNLVSVNGEPKHIDITWGIFNKEYNYMKYFLMSQEEIMNSHVKIINNEQYKNALNNLNISNYNPPKEVGGIRIYGEEKPTKKVGGIRIHGEEKPPKEVGGIKIYGIDKNEKTSHKTR